MVWHKIVHCLHPCLVASSLLHRLMLLHFCTNLCVTTTDCQSVKECVHVLVLILCTIQTKCWLTCYIAWNTPQGPFKIKRVHLFEEHECAYWNLYILKLITFCLDDGKQNQSAENTGIHPLGSMNIHRKIHRKRFLLTHFSDVKSVKWSILCETMFSINVPLVPLPSPQDLMEVEVPIVGHRQCNCDYGVGQITDNMICAGLRAGGKDSCQVIIFTQAVFGSHFTSCKDPFF